MVIEAQNNLQDTSVLLVRKLLKIETCPFSSSRTSSDTGLNHSENQPDGST